MSHIAKACSTTLISHTAVLHKIPKNLRQSPLALGSIYGSSPVQGATLLVIDNQHSNSKNNSTSGEELGALTMLLQLRAPCCYSSILPFKAISEVRSTFSLPRPFQNR